MGKKKPSLKPRLWEHKSTYKNAKGNTDAHYSRIFDSMLYSPAWINLSGTATRLYLLLVNQYRERPEQIGGKIKCPYSFALQNGFKSRETVSRCVKELEELGFIDVNTRGGFGIPNEYILSARWKDISEQEAIESKKRLQESRKK